MAPETCLQFELLPLSDFKTKNNVFTIRWILGTQKYRVCTRGASLEIGALGSELWVSDLGVGFVMSDL